MNILTKVTWCSMGKNKTRTMVTVIGVLLSAAMFTAVVTMGISLWDFLVRGEIHNRGDYFIQYYYITDEEVAALYSDPDITAMADLQITGVLKLSEGAELLVGAGNKSFFDTMPTYLLEGRLPESSREILVPKSSLSLMENCGLKTQIGSSMTIRLDTLPDTQALELLPEQTQSSFVATYTIVGYVDGNMYNDYVLASDHMLTVADGGQGDALWHRIFVKTQPRKIMDLYTRQDGLTKTIHDTLCGLYGVTQYSNVNRVFLGLVAVLCVIIMIGSVSLIYNAFSISVSERTKQFGLLASIGATKKQLRRSVYTEALTLCTMGIPLGVLTGYGGIWLTLKLLAPRINQSLSMAGGAVTLRALCSPLGLVVAAIIALITVLISAAIPAARATAISPMEAIRQNKDYRQPRKIKKISRLNLRIFGLPGALGKAYYTVSRSKYRATVISLVISFVLFVSAASFSRTMQNTTEMNMSAQSFDISVRADLEEMEELRMQPFVERAAYEYQDYYKAYTPDDMLSKEFLECWEEIHQYYRGEYRNITNIRLFYLEDAAMEEYLVRQGIDPKPYFDAACPKALVCKKNVSVYNVDNEKSNRYVFTYSQFAEDTEHLQLFHEDIPESLLVLPELCDFSAGSLSSHYETGPNGELLLCIYVGDLNAAEISLTYQLVLDTSTPGKTVVSFCPYDRVAGTAEASVATETYEVPNFDLGATIEALPYGIPSGAFDQYFFTSLILPLSFAPEERNADTLLHISVSDYPAAVEFMNSHFETREYQDIRSGEEYNRTLLLVIHVFSYGFITLISLISIANVFNTISTNVALRRRDFGVLRSIGFCEKDQKKMMRFECIYYGIRALACSIPLSFLISYLIGRIDSGTYNASYTPPWGAMLIAACSIFCVVFAAMSYSVSKIKKDNPIEAIRMETL